MLLLFHTLLEKALAAAPATHPQLYLQPLIVQKIPFPTFQDRLRAQMLFRLQRKTIQRTLEIYHNYKSKSLVSGLKPHLFGTS